MGIREEFINKYMVHLKGALPRDLYDEWVRAFLRAQELMNPTLVLFRQIAADFRVRRGLYL